MMILDFDNTLYNTNLLKIELEKIFADYGVTPADYASSEQLAIHGSEGTHYDYTVELHIQILHEKGYKIPHEEAVKKIQALFENNYAYEDTIFFLEALKKKNDRMVLLTAGNEQFQRAKIQSIKIEDYFDEIICVRGKKEEYVESVYTPHEKIFFINDKLKENIAVKNQRKDICVITKWNPLKNSEEELKNSGVPYFHTLTEILNYLETYGK